MINYIFMLSCGHHFQPSKSSSSYLPGSTSWHCSQSGSEREEGGAVLVPDSCQLPQLACRQSGGQQSPNCMQQTAAVCTSQAGRRDYSGPD